MTKEEDTVDTRNEIWQTRDPTISTAIMKMST